MIVLGIDPGTANLGYGIIEATGSRLREVDHGCVTTLPNASLPERLAEIHAAVTELIALHRPHLVGVERLYFSRNAQTAFGVGQARGVVLLAAAQHTLPVREATPNEVKSAVAGYGAADKEQVSRMVQVILGLVRRPSPDDAADALAIAICTASRERLAGSLGSATRDRSAIAPIADAGPSPFERAVREAVARDGGARVRARSRA
ncbi:MAG: crossover junction endodeoxyribonuclease RuvC [Chloroflexi bacterium]|nr:crossover junction endodeoxyribonuclease RuvC [Chloroflexota bacterium]